jgi:hypothetical protein
MYHTLPEKCQSNNFIVLEMNIGNLKGILKKSPKLYDGIFHPVSHAGALHVFHALALMSTYLDQQLGEVSL